MAHTTIIADLATHQPIPPDGIISRTVYRDEQIKTLLFGFDTGQELSEHTASMPAIIQIIQGQAQLRLGDETIEAEPGAWIAMPAGLNHAVVARTPVVMLLTLIKDRTGRTTDD
ncbi:MAG: cupin domain-containing protein [Chloroflexi bacterium]|nr:cupin domain-containing protein [Chloroflexota bacterium]